MLAARSFLTERTLVLMADQIAAPHLVKQIMRAPAAYYGTLLGVDRDLSRVFDFDDATKITLAADGVRVSAIGKTLPTYGAVSTSVFVMSTSLVTALEALQVSNLSKDPSLTEKGIAEAARRGQVVAHDVEGAIGQDVDSAEMRLHAEWLVRVYGVRLAIDRRCARRRVRRPPTRWRSFEQLLAEKDDASLHAVQPGPGDDVGAREGGARPPGHVPPRSGVHGRRAPAAGKLRTVFGAGEGHEVSRR